MSRNYDVMAAGHLCLDIIPRFPDTGSRKIGDIMRPGKLVNMKEAKISTGGPVSNTGINMKTLGNKVCFCARVGDDVLGKLTIDMLRNSGNAEGVHIATGISSSYTVVIAPPGIDRIFLHNPGTNNTFSSDDLDPELIAQCQHFHFGYPPLMKNMYDNDGEELMRVFKIAKQAGATTSCDMTLPDPNSESGKVNWRRVLEKTLPYVDIHLPSIEETFYMLYPDKFLEMKKQYNNEELIDYFSAEDYSNIADEIFAMGSKMCSLKSGHRGFYLKTADKSRFGDLGKAVSCNEDNWSCRELWTPAYMVTEFGSATGSGDSSIAGFLSAYLKGLDPEKALKYAVCCGLQNVRVLDAVSGIKSWQETTAMIESDMSTTDINCDTHGWKHNQQFNIWAGPEDMLNGMR